MASRKSFVDLVGDRAKAVEFEAQVLSIDEAFLPEIARRVRSGQVAAGEDLSGYWRWLSGQWVEKEDEL